MVSRELWVSCEPWGMWVVEVRRKEGSHGGSCSSGRLHGNGIRRVKSSQTCGNDAVVAVGEGEQLAQSRE
jgi:hypothetical protein